MITGYCRHHTTHYDFTSRFNIWTNNLFCIVVYGVVFLQLHDGLENLLSFINKSLLRMSNENSQATNLCLLPPRHECFISCAEFSKGCWYKKVLNLILQVVGHRELLWFRILQRHKFNQFWLPCPIVQPNQKIVRSLEREADPGYDVHVVLCF